jgi:hypothetical protein
MGGAADLLTHKADLRPGHPLATLPSLEVIEYLF